MPHAGPMRHEEAAKERLGGLAEGWTSLRSTAVCAAETTRGGPVSLRFGGLDDVTLRGASRISRESELPLVQVHVTLDCGRESAAYGRGSPLENTCTAGAVYRVVLRRDDASAR